MLVAVLAFLFFVTHAFVFGSWIVDDAGISYAYARHLAAGEGLVARAGAEPVEGFSNALWTLLLAAADVVGLFHPVWTPKVLGCALVLASYLLLARALIQGHRRPPLAIGLALAAAAASTPFALWSVSGLENALFVFFVSALAAACLGLVHRGAVEARQGLVLGLLCFGLFLTRPDGIVFLAVPAFLLGVSGVAGSRRGAWIHGAAFVLPWILVTIGRLTYFGDVFPNTYYAKRGPGWRETSALLEDLGLALGGTVFMALVVGIAALAVWLSHLLGTKLQQRLQGRWPLAVLGTFFLTAYAVFELLPTDWMPEHRFGTALFLLGPLLLVEVLKLFAGSGGEGWRRAALPVGSALVLLAAALYSSQHSAAFRRQPTVPFEEVRQLSRSLDAYAESLGVERATILLPDIGGSLWEDRFEVLDLAGLTDRTIGRTLRPDRQAFLDYVLDRAPHLVWVHGYWRKLTDFESVPPFLEAYVTASPQEVLGREDGVLYVRRSLLKLPAAPRPREP